jgi:lipopolysaccharide assembly outer membrane protein LptD (OstA)
VYAQEEGGHNMSIDLPASVFDVKANTITSHVATTIRRDDFEVTGDSLVFDIKKKKGKLLGHVHMLIYNLNNSVGDDADVDAAAASAPAPPAKEK